MSSAKSIVCPFCPLHCDDVTIDGAGTVDVDCDVARQGAQSATRTGQVRVGEQPFSDVDYAELVTRLNLPQRPVVQLGWVSIEQAKSLQRIADQVALQLRRHDAEAAETIARDGIVALTIGETVARADLIWALGTFRSSSPRLPEQLQRSRGRIESVEQMTLDKLARLNRFLDSTASEQDDAFFQTLNQSNYLAVVLGENAFPTGSELLGFESLNRFVSLWNEKPIENDPERFHRAAILRISPHQNLETVFRWRTNEGPTRSSVPTMRPTGPADIRIGDAHVDGHQASLQIGGTDPGSDLAYAYLPAAVAGVHQRGTTIRGDGTVTLALSAPLTTTCDDPIEILARILDAR